jgi:ribokinase
MGSRIVVVGSSNTDMIVKVPQLPKPGETVLGGEFSSAAGGKGANQAVAAARAGGDVTLVARVGDDPFGRQATAGFADNGIDVQYVFVDSDAPSGVALIVVDERGENSIAVASGANARLTRQDVMAAEDAIASADVVVVQLETPLDAVQTAASLASGHGARVVLNPAPAQPLGPEILRHVSVLTPNETEAELLTGVEVASDTGVLTAAETLHAAGVESVLITLGSRGVFVSDSTHRELVPGFTVEAVDATAAGDVFNGALAVALAEGRVLTEAARFANAAAALAVTRLGAQTSVPTRDEIQLLLESRAERQAEEQT